MGKQTAPEWTRVATVPHVSSSQGLCVRATIPTHPAVKTVKLRSSPIKLSAVLRKTLLAMSLNFAMGAVQSAPPISTALLATPVRSQPRRGTFRATATQACVGATAGSASTAALVVVAVDDDAMPGWRQVVCWQRGQLLLIMSTSPNEHDLSHN